MIQCFYLFEIKPWVQENGEENVMMTVKPNDVPNLILVRRQIVLVGLVHQWMFHRHHPFHQETGMTETGVIVQGKDRIDPGKEIARKGIDGIKKRNFQEGDMKRVQPLQSVQKIDGHCRNIESIVTVSSV